MSQNRGRSRQLRAMACLTALALLGSLLSVLPAQAHSASSSVIYASTPAVENNRLCALGLDPGITPRSEAPNPSQMEFHVRFIQDCIAHSTTEMWRTDVRSYTAEHVQVCNYGSHNGSNGSPVSQAATVDGTEHTYKGLPESNGTGTCPGPPNGPSISEILYYVFKVQWKQSQVWHTIGTAKTTAEFEPPAAPSNLRVTEVTPTSVSVAWDDNSSNEDRFELQRSGDEGTTWNQIAQPSQNDISHTDSGVLKGVAYQYRVRAVNENGDSDWSNVVTTTTACASDTDCDGLSNSDEQDVLGTSPIKRDTDGDGLFDPWEVEHPDVEGDGFVLEEFPGIEVTRADVFGPYAGDYCELNGWDLRLPSPAKCFNAPPDPLHKDVFVEMDWQDCNESGCPEAPTGAQVDPLHHAPDVLGLAMVRNMFADAPVTNPDNNNGVSLQILIDESITHEPNCDQGTSLVRADHFGTVDQRNDSDAEAILAAKELVVRYAWSGHSSFSDDPAQCPNPRIDAFGLTGYGIRALEDYDWSPFGSANVGGRDILITLGPVWTCHSHIRLREEMPPPGPCYRKQTIIHPPTGGGLPAIVVVPGIYPARVRDQSGDIKELSYPIARLLGLGETEGGAQLWGRALARLLGRSLGISSDPQVGNQPDVPGVDPDGDGHREIRPPDSYSNWEGLTFSPGGTGLPTQESFPSYDELATQDLDADGVVEGEDSCPGAYNPPGSNGRQADADLDGTGDACDYDADGDGLSNSTATERRGPGPFHSIVDFDNDPSPLDSDNDRLNNHVDGDDDGDSVSDAVDNCRLVSNPFQLDNDSDGFGDRCDVDNNHNGLPDYIEGLLHEFQMDVSTSSLGQRLSATWLLGKSETNWLAGLTSTG